MYAPNSDIPGVWRPLDALEPDPDLDFQLWLSAIGEDVEVMGRLDFVYPLVVRGYENEDGRVVWFVWQTRGRAN